MALVEGRGAARPASPESASGPGRQPGPGPPVHRARLRGRRAKYADRAKYALPGMTPRQMWPFLLYLRSRDTWSSFTTHPSLPGPAPTLTSKGPRRRLPVPCPFSFACPSVGISARKTAPSGLLRLNVAVAVAHTDAKTPSQTVTPEEYALDRIITRVSTNGSNPGLALHADSSGAPAFKLCDLRNPTQVEHRIPWPGGPHFTIYLAPNCADQTLAAGTTYWPVLAGNGYRPTSTTADEQGARGSGWPIGDVASTRTSGSWSNLFSGDTTVTGSGHSER